MAAHPSAPSRTLPASIETDASSFPAALALVGLIALAATALAGWAAIDHGGPAWWVGAIVVAIWGVSGVLVTRRLPGLGPLVALVGLSIGAAVAAAAAVENDPGGGAERWRVMAVALVPAFVLHLALALPLGRFANRWRWILVLVGYAAAVALGVAMGTELDSGLLGLEVVVAALLAVFGYERACRGSSARDRARLQWMGWGVIVASSIAGAVALTNALVDLPESPGLVALAVTGLVPISFVAATNERLVGVIERVLVQTTVVIGLAALVGAIYLLVVIGLGEVPEGEERSVLVLSMAAAALAAVLASPARSRLEEIANQRIYGERTAPEEALKTFAGRMSRAVPMDELLLQLVETLRKTMHLKTAEVWTGSGGTLERTVSVPDRGVAQLTLSGEELSVVSRAKVQGNAWLAVWIPELSGSASSQVRVASVAHLGELLGLIVVERPADDTPFTEEEDTVLTDLARQVGLALHNVRLDSALQASLDELKIRNAELQASRLRIVTAADESRRGIERNLHDGAQQHLVAMAVKIGLARQLVEGDPTTASTLMEELRSDVQDTLGELRELAHGIYPPLLRDRGLGEALRAAANRSVLPADLETEGLDRYPTETEAAVYFCCLEAMQNAGKYAGEGSRLVITVAEVDGELRFEVADDGAGFDPATVGAGHGFENMRDRLGAIGGELTLVASPGGGSKVGGHIPLG